MHVIGFNFFNIKGIYDIGIKIHDKESWIDVKF